MDETYYEQSIFSGRLANMLDLIDPRRLILSDSHIRRCEALVNEFKRTKRLPERDGRVVSDQEMWEARMVVDTCIHPATGEILFAPGRMSAFTPMNIPIAVFMLNFQGPVGTVVMQFVNQTYNAVNNYVNRASAEVPWSELGKSYVVAVTVAVSVVLAARRAVAVYPVLQRFGVLVPYIAVGSAGGTNIAFMRSSEWMGDGVPVTAPDGTLLGTSKVAGRSAVLNTIVTRGLFLPMFPLLIPPMAMSVLPGGAVTELAVITAAIGIGLPCALALLPTTMELDAASLEEELRNRKDANGRPVTTVFASKGL